MERVTFLMPLTNMQVSALLNPESVRVRRRSGLRSLEGRPGTIGGAGGSDDLLISTGGGRTEIELDLVFDVDLVATEPRPGDVRDLTGPIWRLSENDEQGTVGWFRMIWGRRWNVPLVLEAVSERFDRFDAEGNPLRSWLSMRAVRIGEPEEPPPASGRIPTSAVAITPRAPVLTGGTPESVVVVGGGPSGTRVDQVAAELLDGPGSWRAIVDANEISLADLPFLAPSTLLALLPSPGAAGDTRRDRPEEPRR